MKKSSIVFAILCYGLFSCTNQPKEVADTIYTNGKIYTVDEAQPWAEAVAIKDGRFIKVGSNDEVSILKGNNTKVINLDGQFAMPGIVDMHAHPFSGVDMGTGSLNLRDPGNPEANIIDIKEFIANNSGRDVILGGNWSVGGIYKNDSPDKKILDEIVPNIPVFLLSQSGHSAWVNSKALELAEVDENYQNEGSYIFDRYEGTNEPSGTVREMGMVKIMNALHYLSPEDFAPFLKIEVERYNRNGITAIQPAEGSPSWLKGAALLEEEGELNVRLFPALDWLTSQLRTLNDKETLDFIDDWKSYETDQIKPHYVKIFADGAADSHTLLLSEVYADAPDTYGSMYLPVEEYRNAILDYHSKDISVHVHAMGDSTSSIIIDIFEEAEAAFPDSKGVLHFGHAPFVKESDLDRLANLKKVTLNFSPMLAVPHPQMKVFIETPLGKERHQQQYPVKTAIDKGLTIGFGSDFPSSLVPDPESFYYMAGWVTRRVPGQPELGSINPSNAISVEEAIKGFTFGGAQALGYNYAEDFGSIEEGKSADMIVLDRNILEIAKNDIHLTQVERTVFRGRTVFDRSEEMKKLDIIEIEITNKELDNAIDAAELNFLIEDDIAGGHHCFANLHEVKAGSINAPDEVNEAFAQLSDLEHAFVRHARKIYWKNTDSHYWIQWTIKDDIPELWAYDPDLEKLVAVLKVKQK